MALSTLLGWLITQAARLRAYCTHLLLTGAGHVDGWQLPPGLLEPFPADIIPLVSKGRGAGLRSGLFKLVGAFGF